MSAGPQSGVLFPDQVAKPLQVEFDAESLSSDGGAPLLSALDHGVGLTAALAEAWSTGGTRRA